jgi:hypothetical protein
MERAPYPGAFLFIWVFLIRLAGLDERGVKAVRNLRFEFLLQSTVFFRKLRHIRLCEQLISFASDFADIALI